MAEQLLDVPDVGFVLEQERGARVPEGVGRDVLFYLGSSVGASYGLAGHGVREGVAFYGDEEMVVSGILDEHRPDSLDVVLDVPAGGVFPRGNTLLFFLF